MIMNNVISPQAVASKNTVTFIRYIWILSSGWLSLCTLLKMNRTNPKQNSIRSFKSDNLAFMLQLSNNKTATDVTAGFQICWPRKECHIFTAQFSICIEKQKLIDKPSIRVLGKKNLRWFLASQQNILCHHTMADFTSVNRKLDKVVSGDLAHIVYYYPLIFDHQAEDQIPSEINKKFCQWN